MNSRRLSWPLGGVLAAAIGLIALLGVGQPDAQAQTPTEPYYMCYVAFGEFDSRPFVSVDLETQFGETDVFIDGGFLDPFCAPALKGVDGSLDHPALRCWSVAGGAAPNLDVRLLTQLEETVINLDGSPVFLCMPAAQSLVGPVPAGPNYLCYQGPSRVPDIDAVLNITTKFGSSQILIARAGYLCTPVLKNGSGTLDAPRLACYVAGSIPGANVSVDLTTQFGEEEAVPIESGVFFCLPTIKAVGGIAELPDVDGTALETPASSGRNTGVLAGVIAAGVAGAVALGGAAWYARRRRVG